MTRIRWATVAAAGICVAWAGNVHALVDARSDTLQVDNRAGRFETFYTSAVAAHLDPDSRFRLWQAKDGMAAVPPGPEGDAMARTLLDAAWSRYPALVPQLPILTQRAEQTARTLFARDNELLGTTGTGVNTRLVLFVGQFDNNAFTAPPMNGKPATVVMPVENINLRIALAHELTHSIHLQLIHAKNSFGAPVGETMFLEGLAMRTAQRALPDLPDAAYVAMPGETTWYPTCLQRRKVILAGIKTDLDKAGPAIATKYTFGKGNTGMQREAYCAAWIVMGRLLDSGRTLPQLARIPEDQMVQTIRFAMKAD